MTETNAPQPEPNPNLETQPQQSADPQATQPIPAQPIPAQPIPAQPIPPQQPPVPGQPVYAAAPAAPESEPRKRSRIPWLIGAGAAVALLAVGGVAYAVGSSPTHRSPDGVSAITVAPSPRGNDSDGQFTVPPETVPPATDGSVPSDTSTSPNWRGWHRGQDGAHHGRHFDNSAEIDIDDQQGDGHTVYIGEVRTTLASAHVAIFTENGEFLGSAPVTSSSSPVTVTLTTPLSPSIHEYELVGVLYSDNGSGTLDISRDSPVCERNGDHDAIDEDFEYWVR